MAEKREAFGPMTAGIFSGLFVLFIDSLLPLREWFGGLPIISRILLALSAGLFAWEAARYFEILGDAGAPLGSSERAEYDQLRGELQAGGTPTKVYRKWLTTALDRVDAFFDDAGRNDKSWFAHALRLDAPGARWTVEAFDRSLLLALLYPLATIILVWMWSGHVGPAEHALGLWASEANNPLGRVGRCLFGLSALWFSVAFRRMISTRKGFVNSFLPSWIIFFGFGYYFRATVATIAISVISFFVGVALSRPLPGAGIVAAILAATIAITPDHFYEFVFAVGRSTSGLGLDLILDGAMVGAAIAFVGGVALLLTRLIGRTVPRGLFLSAFSVLAVILTLVATWLLASSGTWRRTGVLLLVLGMLTLVNAPFDWFAIGLTRALLRRGLSPGTTSPFLLCRD